MIILAARHYDRLSVCIRRLVLYPDALFKLIPEVQRLNFLQRITITTLITAASHLHGNILMKDTSRQRILSVIKIILQHGTFAPVMKRGDKTP